MITDSNYEYLKDKSFPYYNDQELLVGTGSLSNGKIKNCKICAAEGFPREPIIFRKITIIKWVAFDPNTIIKWVEFKRVESSPIFHALVELSAGGDQA